GLLLIGGAARLLADLRRRVTTNRELRAIGTADHDMLVADLPAPMAVAVPGTKRRRGHLLVTAGMLRLLDAREREVLFAHERAHLAHRHHRFTSVVAAAAAVNPLLIPARDTVAYLVERWADEDAAADVGDRALTARAVTRAALATTSAGPASGLGIGGGMVVHRVRALSLPAPAPRYRRLIGLVLLGALMLAVAGAATEAFVDLAQAWL
ncbi:MAG: M48 family metalloprotease, partial [Actinoplanes sp.]